ncbi:unnamed protein product [Chrysoparadoxa australica]
MSWYNEVSFGFDGKGEHQNSRVPALDMKFDDISTPPGGAVTKKKKKMHGLKSGATHCTPHRGLNGYKLDRKPQPRLSQSQWRNQPQGAANTPKSDGKTQKTPSQVHGKKSRPHPRKEKADTTPKCYGKRAKHGTIGPLTMIPANNGHRQSNAPFTKHAQARRTHSLDKVHAKSTPRKRLRNHGMSAAEALEVEDSSDEDVSPAPPTPQPGGASRQPLTSNPSKNSAGIITVKLSRVAVGSKVLEDEGLTLLGKLGMSMLEIRVPSVDMGFHPDLKNNISIPSREVNFFGMCKETEEPFLVISTVDAKFCSTLNRWYDPECTEPGRHFLVLYLTHNAEQYEQGGHHKKLVEHLKEELKIDGRDSSRIGVTVNKEEAEKYTQLTAQEETADKSNGRPLSTRLRRRNAKKFGSSGVPFLVYPPERDAQDTITLFQCDLERTEMGEFLNDSLVDLYLKYLARDHPLHSKDGYKRRESHFLSSHFFSMLKDYSLNDLKLQFASVQRWTKGAALFEKKFVFVPIVEDLHWSLSVICNLCEFYKDGNGQARCKADSPKPCVLFMDSLNSHKPRRILKYLRAYVEMEWESLHPGKQVKFDEDMMPLVQPKVPGQTNGCDCGVFLLQYAEELYSKWPAITESDIRVTLTRTFGCLVTCVWWADPLNTHWLALAHCRTSLQKSSTRQPSPQRTFMRSASS